MGGRDSLEIPFTSECESVAKVLKDRGFVEEVKTFKKEKIKENILRIH